jgi:UDP-N-acetylglucosamine 2-epimerase (non-hydrolysing)/GDP/UDP-N,N'-diacetylbacillosamine 2-epimerase (hydrolysing)
LKRVRVVTVGRSDFDIYRPLLKQIAATADIDCQLIVSGAHLSPEFGLTVEEVEESGFCIAGRIEMLLASDTPEAISKSMGLGTVGFAQFFSEDRPDMLLLLGDRFEMHAAAVAAQPFLIPIAHIGGGALTFGAIDDVFRHSITKMSHLHFVETEAYRERVVRMGEEPWRVTVSGALGLDNLKQMNLLSRTEFESEYGIPMAEPPLIVTSHPVTREYEDTSEHCEELLAAVEKAGLPVVFTAPNADTHGRIIADKIKAFVVRQENAHFVANLGTRAYFSLMRLAAVMVGNSSSGLVEAPSFKLPVVNVGNRQAGRLSPVNVIHVGYSRTEILDGIERGLSPEFRAGLADLVNPYGDGHAAERIVKVLNDIEIGEKLMNKRFYE